MSHEFKDPSSWPRSSATSLAIGLDLGFAADHSALIAAGSWTSGGRSIIGTFSTKQFPIGTPAAEVAEAAATLAKQLQCKLLVDLSNNTAFASVLAGHLGRNPADALVGVSITNAREHSNQPVPLLLSVGGQRLAIPKWSVSKSEMMQTLAAEFDGGTLRLGSDGDLAKLQQELLDLDQNVRPSGSLSFGAPSGRHDDLVAALGIAVFGLRRVAPPAGKRPLARKERFSARAWT